MGGKESIQGESEEGGDNLSHDKRQSRHDAREQMWNLKRQIVDRGAEEADEEVRRRGASG